MGEIPRVRADWQWSGEWWVETDAAMTGAWRVPSQQRCVLLFVNVGEQPISTHVDLDAGSYGLTGEEFQVTPITVDGPGEPSVVPRAVRREVVLPARTALAWELTLP